MKLRNLRIKNFRSVEYADIEIHNYTMLVGANNAGKSNIMAALRAFYENIPWTVKDDSPKFFGFDINNDNFESWVELILNYLMMNGKILLQSIKMKTHLIH